MVPHRGIARGPCAPIVDWVDFLNGKALLGHGPEIYQHALPQLSTEWIFLWKKLALFGHRQNMDLAAVDLKF